MSAVRKNDFTYMKYLQITLSLQTGVYNLQEAHFCVVAFKETSSTII